MATNNYINPYGQTTGMTATTRVGGYQPGYSGVGGTEYKRFDALEIIGNKVSANAYIRYSDNDYTTNSTYRKIDLSAQRSMIRRCGVGRRRSFEIRHLDNTALNIAELDINGG